MTTPSKFNKKGASQYGSYSGGRRPVPPSFGLINAGGINKRSMLGRRKSLAASSKENAKLVAGLNNPETYSVPSQMNLRSRTNNIQSSLDKLLSGVGASRSCQSRLSFGGFTSNSLSNPLKSKGRHKIPSCQTKSVPNSFKSLLATFENTSTSKYGSNQLELISNKTNISPESLVSSMQKSSTKSNANFLSSSKLTSLTSKSADLSDRRKSLRKALFNTNAASNDSTLNKSYLAIPLPTTSKAEETLDITENLESQQEERMPRPRALSSIAESEDATDSMTEFLANETAVEIDAVVPGSSVPSIEAASQPKSSPKNTPDKSIVLDHTPHKENLLYDLINELDEFKNLKNDYNIKFNQLVEIQNKIDQKFCKIEEIKKKLQDKENMPSNSMKLVTCIKKSVKKFQDVSVKFNDSVITPFTVPKTPVTLTKSRIAKRRSIAYTPKSLKKVLTDQVSDLCDS